MSALPAKTPYQVENDAETLIEKHKDQIDQLLAKYSAREDDKIMIYRFLKAFNFNLEQGEASLLESLQWKEENDFKSLIEKTKDMDLNEFPHAKIIHRLGYERDDYCVDDSGNPVVFTKISLLDPVTYMGNISSEMLEAYMKYLFAKNNGYMKRESKSRGFVMREVRVFDLEGLAMAHIKPEALKYLTNIIGPAQKAFPEHMRKTYIINAPSIFSMAWLVIKNFLPQRTIDKISIIGSNYKDALLEVIPESELPTCYGGKNAKVLWEDKEAHFTKATIPSRGTIKVEKNVAGNGIVFWDFRTLHVDVGFSVEFTSSDGKTTEVVKYSRVESFKKIVTGQYQAQCKGKVVVLFDNSYSMLTSKNIIYLVDVLQDGDQKNFQ